MNAPACWEWPVTDELRAVLAEYHAAPDDPFMIKVRLMWRIHELFDQGRCGICGVRDLRMVEDHDHRTGMVRGRLCISCNTVEGRSPKPIFKAYRERYPYAILGIDEPYTGMGWTDGVPDGGWPDTLADRWQDNAMRGVL